MNLATINQPKLLLYFSNTSTEYKCEQHNTLYYDYYDHDRHSSSVPLPFAFSFSFNATTDRDRCINKTPFLTFQQNHNNF